MYVWGGGCVCECGRVCFVCVDDGWVGAVCMWVGAGCVGTHPATHHALLTVGGGAGRGESSERGDYPSEAAPCSAIIGWCIGGGIDK